MSAYEEGRAAGVAEGVRAVEAILRRLDTALRDRDEWKQQHENLLAVRQQDIAALASKATTASASIDTPAFRQRLHSARMAVSDAEKRAADADLIAHIDGRAPAPSRDAAALEKPDDWKHRTQFTWDEVQEQVRAALTQQGAAQAPSRDADELREKLAQADDAIAQYQQNVHELAEELRSARAALAQQGALDVDAERASYCDFFQLKPEALHGLKHSRLVDVWLAAIVCHRRRAAQAAHAGATPTLARQAVASVVSRVGDELRIGWLRPERCDVGDLLYTIDRAAMSAATEREPKNG